jgi:hypothetical protein
LISELLKLEPITDFGLSVGRQLAANFMRHKAPRRAGPSR